MCSYLEGFKWVRGLGFRVQGKACGIWGVGYRIQDWTRARKTDRIQDWVAGRQRDVDLNLLCPTPNPKP